MPKSAAKNKTRELNVLSKDIGRMLSITQHDIYKFGETSTTAFTELFSELAEIEHQTIRQMKKSSRY